MSNSQIDLDEGKALADFLRSESKKPNVLTLADFRKYAVLFRKHENLTAAQEKAISEITQEYFMKIDVYKETHVIKSARDQTLVLRLPNLFTQVRSLSRTPQNEQLAAVANKMAASGASPRDKTVALGRMAQAFIDEQSKNGEVVIESRRNYIQIINELRRIYGKESVPEGETAIPAEPLSEDDDFEID